MISRIASTPDCGPRDVASIISLTVVTSAPWLKTPRWMSRATALTSAPGADLARMVVPTGKVANWAIAASEPAKPHSPTFLTTAATRNSRGPSGPARITLAPGV